jgi:hypothetical protein
MLAIAVDNTEEREKIKMPAAIRNHRQLQSAPHTHPIRHLAGQWADGCPARRIGRDQHAELGGRELRNDCYSAAAARVSSCFSAAISRHALRNTRASAL